jgi:hypothetical protein
MIEGTVKMVTQGILLSVAMLLGVIGFGTGMGCGCGSGWLFGPLLVFYLIVWTMFGCTLFIQRRHGYQTLPMDDGQSAALAGEQIM